MNYEGGVLGNAARVAIHFTHRLGALVATVALESGRDLVLRDRTLVRARPAAIAVLAALALQLAIGITMVREGLPAVAGHRTQWRGRPAAAGDPGAQSSADRCGPAQLMEQ